MQSAGGLPDDEVDISSLFGEDEEESSAAAGKPEEAQPAAAAPETVKAETPAADPKKQGLLGRFQQTGKPAADTSRDAAAETLRKFMGRR